MDEIAKLILSKEGIFAFGFFSLTTWVLHTNNQREIRYIDTINSFSDRFDNIEDKVEKTEKLLETKFDTVDKKIDILVYKVHNKS